MMGASFLAGVAGAVLYDSLRSRPLDYGYGFAQLRPRAGASRTGAAAGGFRSRPKSGWKEMFRDEIDQVKGVAIGYLMALGRDWAKQNFPDLAPQIDDFMHGATEKLGGYRSAIRCCTMLTTEPSRQEESSPFSRH